MTTDASSQQRLSDALKQAATLYDLVLEEETLDFLLAEAELPSTLVETVGSDRTLDDVQGNPLVASLYPHVVDLLDLEEPLLFLSEVLDRFESPSVSQEVQAVAKVSDCEMCERNMPLTIHHLLPVCQVHMSGLIELMSVVKEIGAPKTDQTQTIL